MNYRYIDINWQSLCHLVANYLYHNPFNGVITFQKSSRLKVEVNMKKIAKHLVFVHEYNWALVLNWGYGVKFSQFAENMHGRPL